MLVVDRHTLVAVDLLHFFDEVALGLTDTLDVKQFLGILRTFDQSVTSGDLLTVSDLEVGTGSNWVGVFVTVVGDDVRLDRSCLLR